MYAEELVVGHEYLLTDGTKAEVCEIRGQEDWAIVVVEQAGKRSEVKVSELRHLPNTKVVHA
jgi:NADPH-dependent 7-cyano-7-deazaguanine reductase QueF